MQIAPTIVQYRHIARELFKSRWTEYLFLLLVLSASIFLFTANLGNRYLWQDEAMTALVSKTILYNGIPLGWDGRNSFSQEMGREYTKDYVWRWQPWLPFYVIAFFFKIFGVSTFVARLPSAIFGILTIFLTYLFCKSLWQNRKIAVVATILLLVCVPFLILSRQGRYFSMSAFLSICGLYAYLKILDTNDVKSYVAFALASVLLFYTHYVYCAALLATTVLHTMLFCRKRLIGLSLTAGVIILCALPWIIWIWDILPFYGVREISVINQCIMLTHCYLVRIIHHLFPFYLIIFVLLLVIVSKVKTGTLLVTNRLFWQRLSLLLFFIIVNILILVIVRSLPFFRYLTPLIPVMMVLIAVLICSIAEKIHPVLAAVIVIIMVLTSPLKDFLYEVTHDYDGPIEGIVKYLNCHGSENDTVVISYGDLSLKFYTKMRVIGGLTGEDLSEAKQAKWIILRKHINCERDADVIRYIKMLKLPRDDYENIEIDYTDVLYENSDDPEDHLYRTATREPKVLIYHKIR